MSTRATELVTGKEVYLQVEKMVSSVATFVTVGCASTVNYDGQQEILTANCQSGKKKVPSGDDAEYTLSLDGFVFVYATGNVDTNWSAKEFEEKFLAKTELNCKLAMPHTGDPVRAFKAFISSFGLVGEIAGIATYKVGLTMNGLPTLSAQT